MGRVHNLYFWMLGFDGAETPPDVRSTIPEPRVVRGNCSVVPVTLPSPGSRTPQHGSAPGKSRLTLLILVAIGAVVGGVVLCAPGKEAPETASSAAAATPAPEVVSRPGFAALDLVQVTAPVAVGVIEMDLIELTAPIQVGVIALETVRIAASTSANGPR